MCIKCLQGKTKKLAIQQNMVQSSYLSVFFLWFNKDIDKNTRSFNLSVCCGIKIYYIKSATYKTSICKLKIFKQCCRRKEKLQKKIYIQ